MEPATHQSKILASAIKTLQRKERLQAFDPEDPESRPTPKQSEIMRNVFHRHIYVVAGNQSGKTQLGGWVTARKFEENHPHWERSHGRHCQPCGSTDFKISPTRLYTCNDCGYNWRNWKKEKLTILVCARLNKHITEIWETKIEPYLEPGTYTVERDGQYLSRIVHKKNGNKIYFFSHDKANEAREKVQMFVAHHVWCDEMPKDISFITELQQRVTARGGQLMCTFTPVIKNDEIKEMVDAVVETLGIKYMMSKLDNPIYVGREQEVMDEVAGLPPDVQNCRLYGHWLAGEMSVFSTHKEVQIKVLPREYSPRWEHVAAIDPASAGNAGLIVCARSATSPTWHVVLAEYIAGRAGSELVKIVESKIAMFNVVKRVYDPHETWFHKEALLSGIYYEPVWNKTQRKKELIVQLQETIYGKGILIPVTFAALIKELRSAEWKDAMCDSIKNSTKYHLLDALQYLLDIALRLPAIEKPLYLTHDEMIYTLMKEELKTKDAEKKKPTSARQKSSRSPNDNRRSRLWAL